MKEVISLNSKQYILTDILSSTKNISLIEVIEALGIHVPSFCYHSGLSISGNCRMCFIEAKNALKPIIACVVNTKSYLNTELFSTTPLTLKSRENIMEFLLINHPIDCAVCDQGGECDLQDHSLLHGISNKRFFSYKRTVDDKNVGPVIKTSMTKCIHCTRCIRFGIEIAGIKELGIFNRGVYSEVGVYKTDGLITSELSGNLVDLCPVGCFSNTVKVTNFLYLKQNYFK